jgi:hypothetical protein
LVRTRCTAFGGKDTAGGVGGVDAFSLAMVSLPCQRPVTAMP